MATKVAQDCFRAFFNSALENYPRGADEFYNSLRFKQVFLWVQVDDVWFVVQDDELKVAPHRIVSEGALCDRDRLVDVIAVAANYLVDPNLGETANPEGDRVCLTLLDIAFRAKVESYDQKHNWVKKWVAKNLFGDPLASWKLFHSRYAHAMELLNRKETVPMKHGYIFHNMSSRFDCFFTNPKFFELSAEVKQNCLMGFIHSLPWALLHGITTIELVDLILDRMEIEEDIDPSLGFLYALLEKVYPNYKTDPSQGRKFAYELMTSKGCLYHGAGEPFETWHIGAGFVQANVLGEALEIPDGSFDLVRSPLVAYVNALEQHPLNEAIIIQVLPEIPFASFNSQLQLPPNFDRQVELGDGVEVDQALREYWEGGDTIFAAEKYSKQIFFFSLEISRE